MGKAPIFKCLNVPDPILASEYLDNHVLWSNDLKGVMWYEKHEFEQH